MVEGSVKSTPRSKIVILILGMQHAQNVILIVTYSKQLESIAACCGFEVGFGGDDFDDVNNMFQA